jgi:hypothetical protein
MSVPPGMRALALDGPTTFEEFGPTTFEELRTVEIPTTVYTDRGSLR